MPDPFHTLFGLAGLSLLARVDANAMAIIRQQNNHHHHDHHSSSQNGGSNHDNGGGVGAGEIDEEEGEKEDPAIIALKVAYHKLKPIHPVLCMPQYVIDRLKLKFQLL
ncbi:unnamed protein product [Trichobilharzia regenti]|nr:unnamed protein product [Trichobilharzia regenti]